MRLIAEVDGFKADVRLSIKGTVHTCSLVHLLKAFLQNFALWHPLQEFSVMVHILDDSEEYVGIIWQVLCCVVLNFLQGGEGSLSL